MRMKELTIIMWKYSPAVAHTNLNLIFFHFVLCHRQLLFPIPYSLAKFNWVAPFDNLSRISKLFSMERTTSFLFEGVVVAIISL